MATIHQYPLNMQNDAAAKGPMRDNDNRSSTSTEPDAEQTPLLMNGDRIDTIISFDKLFRRGRGSYMVKKRTGCGRLIPEIAFGFLVMMPFWILASFLFYLLWYREYQRHL